MKDTDMRLLCIGDSNTYGYDPSSYFGGRYPACVRWTDNLDGWEVVNCGMNGLSIPADGKVWRNLIESKNPNLITIMLGSNDMKICYGASCEDIAEGMRAVVKAAVDTLVYKQKYAPEVIIVSPPEITEDVINGPFAGSFDEACCEKSKCLAKYYLSVASDLGVGFLNAAEYIRPSKEDGLHLTADAHKGLAEAVASMIVS